MDEQSNSNGDSRKWEEDMYWNHFKSLHFFQSLSAQFHHHLAIPKKFINNLREKLAESVVLKGPSCDTWIVGITTSDDTLILRHGWDEFVSDHLLKEGDLLVFKYNGDSRFDVLIFDPLNCCEKEASYFVRKSLCTEPVKGCSAKRKIAKDTVPDEIGPTPPLKLQKCNAVEQTPGTSDRRTFEEPVRETDTRRIFEEPTPETNTTRTFEEQTPETDTTRTVDEETAPQTDDSSKVIKEEPTFITNNSRAITTISKRYKDDEPENSSIRLGGYRTYFRSNRRKVTEEEIQNAYQRALSAKSEDGLVVTMRPSHVYRGFFMGIYREWANSHLPYKNQDLILRVGQNTWKVSLYCRSGAGSGLQGGWRNFVGDNFLEEHDVCLFELDGDDENDEIVMDVNIFRVVEPVVPPTLCTGHPPKKVVPRQRSSSRRRNRSEF